MHQSKAALQGQSGDKATLLLVLILGCPTYPDLLSVSETDPSSARAYMSTAENKVCSRNISQYFTQRQLTRQYRYSDKFYF